MNQSLNPTPYTGLEIAIIGMAGRFPGAPDLNQFWENLRQGVESVSVFSDEEVLAAGVDPQLLKEPNYVKAGGVIEGIEFFDADFFNLSPREAELTDPQHRIFLETAWHALETAGYDPSTCAELIGVYGGASISSYLITLLQHPGWKRHGDELQLLIGNDKDFLATRTSYKLGLQGPSYSVQTACSTSLVAVHLACQGLLSGECDIALAGGVSIQPPQKAGYLYREGGVRSPDGHCRAFDAQAQGSIHGNGLGIVVLKRLQEALESRDPLLAVIKGSALNNDGSLKVSYTAPRVDSQASVIRTAQAMAEVNPDTISYVETHGTGTSLGDPIEITALTQAFRAHTQRLQFCRLGSVKTNIGHLDAAAGVAGLIKTVLSLYHRQIPPSLNFQTPNPQIDFAHSPFHVNTQLIDWPTGDHPRRAGVSSFGIGGTNAHVILEEAPSLPASGPSRPRQILLISARTAAALDQVTADLAAYLRRRPDLNLADVAYTLRVGRKGFEHRRLLICHTLSDAVQALDPIDPQRVLTQVCEPGDRPVVFMFPGQGSQYINMGRDLYESEPIFREEMDRCCEMLLPHLGLDLRGILYPQSEEEPPERSLHETALAQPALFVLEYALAQLWIRWGIVPHSLMGHSLGEIVAACVSKVFKLEDALKVVAVRGQLMGTCPAGAMLSVQLPEAEIRSQLGSELTLAAHNAPDLWVISGPREQIDQLEVQLKYQQITCRRLQVSHGFHSPLMRSVQEPLLEQLCTLELHPPQIPFLSTLTGTWITSAEATDPCYWAKLLEHLVLFSETCVEILSDPQRIYIEVGPGRTLGTLLRRHQQDEVKDKITVLSSLRHPQEEESDLAFLLNSLGRLWLQGMPVDWKEFNAEEDRQRLSLPNYPFQRQRYWLDFYNLSSAQGGQNLISMDKKEDITDWFYLPSWKRSLPPKPKTRERRWLIFLNPGGIGSQLAIRLQKQGQQVATVVPGDHFARLSNPTHNGSLQLDYQLKPQDPKDYQSLLSDLQYQGFLPDQVVHLWSLTEISLSRTEISLSRIDLPNRIEAGYASLLRLVQAWSEITTDPAKLTIISNGLKDLSGTDPIQPENSLLLGACRVIPQEYEHINCQSIDFLISSTDQQEQPVDLLLDELWAETPDPVIVYRGSCRWIESFEPVKLGPPEENFLLRPQGVYLITGGFGTVGLILAESLARSLQAKLILVSRTELPPRQTWQGQTYSKAIQNRIQQIQTLESLGAEVCPMAADVGDLRQMQDVVHQAQARFGPIQGVIHAAVNIEKRWIRDCGTDLDLLTSAKVQGALVLDQICREIKPDFLLLCSSQASYLGGLRSVIYAAENAFLDALAHHRNHDRQTYTLAVNWDRWIQGESSSSSRTDPLRTEIRRGLSPQEGVEVFYRLLSRKLAPQIIVSTQPFQDLIEHTAIDLKGSLKSLQEEWLQSRLPQKTHPRPDLPTLYVAPRNDTEQTLADLWQRVLGITPVGINDNFFDLGGDSLMATVLVSQTSKRFGIDVPFRRFFQAPTVAASAQVVLEILDESTDELWLKEALSEIEDLSEEEVEQQLSQERQKEVQR